MIVIRNFRNTMHRIGSFLSTPLCPILVTAPASRLTGPHPSLTHVKASTSEIRPSHSFAAQKICQDKTIVPRDAYAFRRPNMCLAAMPACRADLNEVSNG